MLAVILNLTPVLRENYRVGLPQGGFWREAINTDSGFYGGSNQGNFGGVHAEDYQTHRQPFSAMFTLPPLSVMAFCPETAAPGVSRIANARIRRPGCRGAFKIALLCAIKIALTIHD